jgi:hypothetical protein
MGYRIGQCFRNPRAVVSDSAGKFIAALKIDARAGHIVNRIGVLRDFPAYKISGEICTALGRLIVVQIELDSRCTDRCPLWVCWKRYRWVTFRGVDRIAIRPREVLTGEPGIGEPGLSLHNLRITATGGAEGHKYDTVSANTSAG